MTEFAPTLLDAVATLCAGLFAGAALYIAFFVAIMWRYRRDSTPIGIAGAMGVVTMFFYMPLYRSIGIQLAIVMVGVGLWWRSAVAQQAAARTAAGGNKG
jgi:hypothetical protein